jgi:hypothetical protein
MPKLQDLVLWNGENVAPSFITRQSVAEVVKKAKSPSHATAHAIFNFDDVAASSEKVAYVQVKYEQLHKDIIHSHSDAIHHLCLPRDVIGSESLL